jgi:hypothetical protein
MLSVSLTLELPYLSGEMLVRELHLTFWDLILSPKGLLINILWIDLVFCAWAATSSALSFDSQGIGVYLWF